MPPRLLKVKEAAEQLHVSRSTLFRMARVGQIKFTRLGPRSNRVKQDEIERLIERRTR